MIHNVTLSGHAGSVEVYHSPGVISWGLVDLTVRPRLGEGAQVTMTPAECRELADALTRAAEEAEGA